MEVINIDFKGYIQVDKNDLKIQKIEDEGFELVDVDTTVLTGEEVVNLLKSGKGFLKSFGETYLNDVLDGEENFEFSVEENY